MMRLFLIISAGFAFAAAVNALNSPVETTDWGRRQWNSPSDISFRDDTGIGSRHNRPRCKAFPGNEDWPTFREWSQLNKSINGALLKPVPAASACYDGQDYNSTQCHFLLTGASETRFYSDDPLTVLTQWPQGNTCLASSDPKGNCTRGGFPVYVANVTTVEAIQAAVNFARRNNVRLVIKYAGRGHAPKDK